VHVEVTRQFILAAKAGSMDDISTGHAERIRKRI
jgi:hypothetical protein